jgi:hypothetical protein
MRSIDAMPRTLRRLPHAATLVCLAVLVLVSRRGLGSAFETSWLVVVWSAAVWGMVERDARARRVALAFAGILTALLWTVDVETWMIGAAGLSSVVALGPLVVPSEPSRGRRVDLALCAGVGVIAPLGLTALIAAFGGDEARRAVTGAFRVAWPGVTSAVAALLLLMAASWVVLSLASLSRKGAARRASVVASAFSILVGLVLAARLAWVVSEATLPTDMIVWSEPPILLNLLKLHVGATFYAPMRLVNSYTYSPLLELVHHGLLRPFGLDLSLLANRVLVLGWQLAAVGVLAWALWARVAGLAQAAIPRGARGLLVATLALVVLSSLLAPFLHPDHPLMLCLALAVAVLVAEERMPRWLYWTLLFLTPILATAFKLTGPGFGLGLVLAFSWERRWREVGVLAVSGLCALATIPLFNATLGAFSAYTIGLQTSHPIEWRKLWALTSDVPGRLGALALCAFVAAHVRAPKSPDTAAARRVLWLTFGAMTTCGIAFAKFSGRTNDLLPLSIGAVVVLLVSLPVLFERAGAFDPRGARLLPPLALALGLELCPFKVPVLGQARRRIAQEHALVVETLRMDLAAGGHPLLYSGTVAWLEAGARSVPLDRAHSAAELYLGRRPEVATHLSRLDSGRYDMIIASAATFWPGRGHLRGLAAELKGHMSAHYRLVEPCDAAGHPYWPTKDGSLVVILRWRHARQSRRSAKR